MGVANELFGATVHTVHGAPALVFAGDNSRELPPVGWTVHAHAGQPDERDFYLMGFAVEIDAPGATPTDAIVRVAQTVA
jgi:hypothetical protein